MLNPFPIQFLAPLTYFLLRIVLGVLCIVIAHRLIRREPRTAKRSVFALLLFVTGSSFIFGFMTQFGALFALLLELFLYRFRSVTGLSRTSVLLMIAISLTLFVTGAGPFAFDLPI